MNLRFCVSYDPWVQKKCMCLCMFVCMIAELESPDRSLDLNKLREDGFVSLVSDSEFKMDSFKMELNIFFLGKCTWLNREKVPASLSSPLLLSCFFGIIFLPIQCSHHCRSCLGSPAVSCAIASGYLLHYAILNCINLLEYLVVFSYPFIEFFVHDFGHMSSPLEV